MYNKTNDVNGGSSENTEKKPNADMSKSMLPPARPATINTAAAQASRSSWAAVAAGVPAYSPSLSTSRTSQASELTSATSFTTSSIWSPITPAEITRSASLAGKPSWEASVADQTSYMTKPIFTVQDEATEMLSKTPYEVSAELRKKPGLPAQDKGVRMSGGSPPKSPVGLNLQFGSFDANESLTTHKVEMNRDSMLTSESKQPTDINTTVGAFPDKSTSAAHQNVGADARPNTRTNSHKPFGAERRAADQPRVSRNDNASGVMPAARDYAKSTATPSKAVSKSATDDDSGSVVTNPYERKHSSKRHADPKTPAKQIIPDNVSDCSAITPHYTTTHPHLIGRSPEIFNEHPNRECFRMQMLKDDPPVTEALPDAVETVLRMNPPTFSMEMGARVVCVKTDFVANIHCSIKTLVWAATEKVGLRINRLWNARMNAKESVIIMFSVNGQKSYCGLGKMQGPWERGTIPSDWKSSDGGSGHPVGLLPIQWCFLKNVSYEHLRHIKHPGNNQPIVNMWNGMHFPFDQGRKVVEIFVRNAHFTNVLCYREDRPYNPYKEISHPAQLDPRLRDKSTRPGFHLTNTSRGQASRRGRIHDRMGQVARVPIYQASPAPSHGRILGEISSTPTKGMHGGVSNASPYTTPSPFNAQGSPARRPGQMIQCIIDEHGNYVPIGPPLPPSPTPNVHPSGLSFVPPRQLHASRSGFMPPPQPQFQGYGSMYPQHQMSLQTAAVNGVHGAAPIPTQGNYSVGRAMHPSQPHINIGNPQMHMPGLQTGSPGFLRHVQSTSNVRGGFMQQGGYGGFASQHPQHFPPQAGMQRANMQGNLRPMQSMVNVGSGPQYTQNTGNGAQILRAAASKPNTFVPAARLNTINEDDTADSTLEHRKSSATIIAVEKKQYDEIQNRVAFMEDRMWEIERKAAEEGGGPVNPVSAWMKQQRAYKGVMIGGSVAGSSRRPPSSADLQMDGDDLMSSFSGKEEEDDDDEGEEDGEDGEDGEEETEEENEGGVLLY